MREDNNNIIMAMDNRDIIRMDSRKDSTWMIGGEREDRDLWRLV